MEGIVSVIVPIYNVEEYIERCINSVLNQSYKGIELILVNDGSTDGSRNIIEKSSQNSKIIKVINKPNEGVVSARKAGLEIATGDYILFLDGDDWLESNAIDILYNNAITNNSDIVLFNGNWISDNRIEHNNTYKEDCNITDDLLKNLLVGNILPGIVFKFISREFINSTDIKCIPNINYGEDLATTATLFLNKPKVTLVKKYLYNYYQRKGSITQITSKAELDLLVCVEYIEELFNSKEIFKENREELEVMIYIHIFEYKIIVRNIRDSISKALYKGYKNKNIRINENRYIHERISKLNINEQRRIKVYNRSYWLGNMYDFSRLFVKGILSKVNRVSYEN